MGMAFILDSSGVFNNNTLLRVSSSIEPFLPCFCFSRRAMGHPAEHHYVPYPPFQGSPFTDNELSNHRFFRWPTVLLSLQPAPFHLNDSLTYLSLQLQYLGCFSVRSLYE
jgi:hypothetical protein